MGTNRSFVKRARQEVERIKAQVAAEEERKQARMKELAEQARERRGPLVMRVRQPRGPQGAPATAPPIAPTIGRRNYRYHVKRRDGE